jgi:16S rRNA pseudouridine516 synthase
MRLDRCLARSGLGTRSEVRRLLRRNLVMVNGQIVTDGGYLLDEDAAVSVDGQVLDRRRVILLMLNKPAGVITAMTDERWPTVADLIPARYRTAGLFPVGRLDRDATGLLILTNDGTLGHRLASPHWAVWKTYRVSVDGSPLTEADVPVFAAGLQLKDGQICRPADLVVLDQATALLSIHEGKFHQVKRMMLATGREVTALHREAIGPLALDQTLQPGQSRALTDEEVDALVLAVSRRSSPPSRPGQTSLPGMSPPPRL